MKQFKARSARNLPSIDYDRNAAWLQLAALATSLTAWLRHLALEGDLAKASTKTLRFADPVRPSAAGHPRQTTNPEDPTRLAMVHRSGHRLEPPPSPTSRLTRPTPVPTTPRHPAGHGTRRPPEHPAMPATLFPPQNDPQLRRS